MDLDLEKLIAHIESRCSQVRTTTYDANGRELLVVPPHHTVHVVSEPAAAPRRKKGQSEFFDAASLCAWTLHQLTPATVIFANPAAGEVTVIVDYHSRNVDTADPRDPVNPLRPTVDAGSGAAGWMNFTGRLACPGDFDATLDLIREKLPAVPVYLGCA